MRRAASSRLFPAVPVYADELTGWRPRRWAGALLFVAAAGTLIALAVARWNPWSLAVLHDNDGPLGYLAVAGLLVVAGVVALLPPWRRWSGAGWVSGAVAGALLAVAVLTTVADRGSPQVVAHASTADGALTVRVEQYTGSIDPAWEVVIERRADGRVREARAGCIYGEIATYEKLLGITAGVVRLQVSRVGASAGVVEIRFDPVTLRVTHPIASALCA